MIDEIKLSKFMAYVLRHNPDKFGLSMDKKGFVKTEDLLGILKDKHPEVNIEVIEGLINNSGKKRFEIVDDKIRATYGHSVDIELDLKEADPPEILYHGTSRKNVSEIKKSGIRPMGRKYVHLSLTEEDARMIGFRRDDRPAVLQVKAKEASGNGIKFFFSQEIYLVKEIPKEFIVWD